MVFHPEDGGDEVVKAVGDLDALDHFGPVGLEASEDLSTAIGTAIVYVDDLILLSQGVHDLFYLLI